MTEDRKVLKQVSSALNSDEPTTQRIHEHISNEADQITVEDIKNVRTDFSTDADGDGPLVNGLEQPLREEPVEHKGEHEKEATGKDESDSVGNNVWNVLGA